jgi:hypothetical protein
MRIPRTAPPIALRLAGLLSRRGVLVLNRHATTTLAEDRRGAPPPGGAQVYERARSAAGTATMLLITATNRGTPDLFMHSASYSCSSAFLRTRSNT